MTDRLPAASRLAAVDIIRGLAVLAMVSYHLSWDLAYAGFVSWDVTGDPPWRAYAMAIAGSFLCLSGLSLVLSTRAGLVAGRYFRRVLKIGAAAGLVSLATRLAFPDAWVFFGILHMIAVGSLLAYPLLYARPLSLLALAALALALPWIARSPAFDAPLLWPLGLSATTPLANDYVPIFPWLAPMLAGMAVGRLVVDGHLPLPRVAAESRPGRLTAFLGRWSLPIYLAHQPILFGLVTWLASVLPADPAVESARFQEGCVSACLAEGQAAGQCRAFCGCVTSALEGTSYWSVRGGDPTLTDLLGAAATTCQGVVAPPAAPEDGDP